MKIMPGKQWSVVAMLLIAGFTSRVVVAYDVYKAVPDVDKTDPSNVHDLSCWLADAANILAGAGWGKAGETDPQRRANAIYRDQLMPNFGNGAYMGASGVAVNWWLYRYGYNPDAGSDYYRPELKYSDVTMLGFGGPLTKADYKFLLDELKRCQYVSLTFERDGPNPDDPPIRHALTLVGGNYPDPSGSEGAITVVHDSNGDQGSTGDDEYTSEWEGEDDLWFIGDDQAMYATILCPGLQKPKSAMENYDVAYFNQCDSSGHVTQTFRYAGAKKNRYTNDQGGHEARWLDDTILMVPNEAIDNRQKELWLLIDFVNRGVDRAVPDIRVVDDDGRQYSPLPDYQWSDERGQILFHWRLNDQPAWEKIVFPDDSYRKLGSIGFNQVKDWNLATTCVPEPTSLSLVGLAVVMLWCRRTL
jgi:hypothetical protein